MPTNKNKQKRKAKPVVLKSNDVLALIAQSIILPLADDVANASRDISRTYQAVTAGGFSTSEWSRCYRQTRRNLFAMYSAMCDGFGPWTQSGHRSLLVQVGRGFSELRKMSRTELETMKQKPTRLWPRYIRRGARLFQLVYRSALRPALLNAMNQAKPKVTGDTNDFEVDFETPAGRDAALRGLFMSSVFALHLFEVNKMPSELLRAARSGDGVAAEQLLRIDKQLIFDPKIAARFAAECNMKRSNYCYHVLRGLAKKPKQLSPKFCKVRAAAMISDLAKASEVFSVQGIRRTYDEMVRVETDGKVRVDTRLPASPEAWERAVRRSRDQLIRSRQKQI